LLAEPENTVTNIWRLLQSIRVSLLRRERWDTAIFWGISGLINDNYTSPATHRTDHLRAATFGGGQDKQKFGEHYMALMRHYGLTPTKNNASESHENGDVEQAHYRIKERVHQALLLRGSRDFSSRGEYESFLRDVVAARNKNRRKRLEERTGGHETAAGLSPGGLSGVPGTGWPLEHGQSRAQHVFRPLASDPARGRCKALRRSRGDLFCRPARGGDGAHPGRGQSAHRLSPCNRIPGPQTRRLRTGIATGSRCFVPPFSGRLTTNSRKRMRCVPAVDISRSWNGRR